MLRHGTIGFGLFVESSSLEFLERNVEEDDIPTEGLEQDL